MKIKHFAVVSVLCLLLSFATGCSGLDEMIRTSSYTKTTDIANYGEYTGTADEEYIQEFINSFFPTQIDSTFLNPKYSYCVENLDTYGFEVYLEFTIEDKTEFDSYINNITEPENWQEFTFDSTFLEYEIRDGFNLVDRKPENKQSAYGISAASIKKILYCAEDQTIIYWGLGVHDGGFADTEYFGTFFSRFAIDPVEYELQAYVPGPDLVNP